MGNTWILSNYFQWVFVWVRLLKEKDMIVLRFKKKQGVEKTGWKSTGKPVFLSSLLSPRGCISEPHMYGLNSNMSGIISPQIFHQFFKKPVLTNKLVCYYFFHVFQSRYVNEVFYEIFWFYLLVINRDQFI